MTKWANGLLSLSEVATQREPTWINFKSESGSISSYNRIVEVFLPSKISYTNFSEKLSLGKNFSISILSLSFELLEFDDLLLSLFTVVLEIEVFYNSETLYALTSE